VAALNDILIKMNATTDKNMETSTVNQIEMKANIHDISKALSKLTGLTVTKE
jgi:hypothetical protein